MHDARSDAGGKRTWSVCTLCSLERRGRTAGAPVPRSSADGDSVFLDLACQGIPVHAEPFGRAGEVAVARIEHVLDEARLERAPAFVQGDPSLHHFADEPVEQIAHRHLAG